MAWRSCLESIVSSIVPVHPHEISPLIHSFSCFFFLLSAYFVILPLRDEGAISLGLDHLPGLFMGSLILTLVAAPVSTLIFSLPNVPRAKSRATHICLDCGFIYTQQKPFDEQPDSYVCPQCRAPKKRFARYDVGSGKPIDAGLPPIGVIFGLVLGIAGVGALLVYGLQ